MIPYAEILAKQAELRRKRAEFEAQKRKQELFEKTLQQGIEIIIKQQTAMLEALAWSIRHETGKTPD